jgi:hypothetical protein
MSIKRGSTEERNLLVKYIMIMLTTGFILGGAATYFSVPFWISLLLGFSNGIYWRVQYEKELRK